MCDKCKEIDNTIQHYQRISWSITDQFTIDGINELSVRLEALRPPFIRTNHGKSRIFYGEPFIGCKV